MLSSNRSLWPFLGLRSSTWQIRTLMLRTSALRSRECSFEMIPPWINKQLFGGLKTPERCIGEDQGKKTKQNQFNDDIKAFISFQTEDTLNASQLSGGKDFKKLGEGFDLPGLTCRHVSSYFRETALKQIDQYMQFLHGLIIAVPPPPQTWELCSGWTCYKDGCPPQSVEFPESNALVFDLEVCVKESLAPVLATAVTPGAWYSWVSPSLFQNGHHRHGIVHVDDLVPLGLKEGQKCVVVGHYVVYDAIRIKESYNLQQSGLRYFDTMAAHISISGITNLQKFCLAKYAAKLPWAKLASGNSLSHLFHLYCGRNLDKSKRNIFVEGSLEDIRENFQELTSYCAKDVLATHAIFCKLFPMLLERFPHPVTMAAMLEMSRMYMPISRQWPSLLHEGEENSVEIEREINFLMHQIAQETCELLHNNRYAEDPWMWDQNWSVKLKNTSPKSKKSTRCNREEKGSNVLENHLENSSSAATLVSMSEYPEWFRKIAVNENNCSWNEQLSLTLGMNITPKLLRLCWGPFPLHFLRGYGWGMLVPSSEVSVETKILLEKSIPADSIYKMCSMWPRQHTDPSTEDLANLRDSIENANSSIKGEKKDDIIDSTTEIKLHSEVLFRKLPHFQGIGKNVGSPFSKDLVNNPALCSRDRRGQQILNLLRQKQFWNKYSDKFLSLPVVWSGSCHENGAIIPETVVTGDFNRHPKEELLSALSLEEQELSICRAMESPPGWWFLSSLIPEVDVWMASLLSDSIGGKYGATTLGEMVLKNSYYNSVSSIMEVTEEQARWLTHAVLFGAQRGFIARMLRQIDPSLSKWKALGRADRLLEYLVGTCSSRESHPSQKTWQGGVQSELWSKLVVAASKLEVKTPILSSRLSRVLESDTENFSALAMSWIIQSSSTDFLHLLITSFRDLAPSAHLSFISSSKLCIYYLVPERDMYHAAKSLHLAHLYARAFCASCVGIYDLPLISALLPHVQLCRFLKPTSQDRVIKLNFFEAHLKSEQSDCARKAN